MTEGPVGGETSRAPELAPEIRAYYERAPEEDRLEGGVFELERSPPDAPSPGGAWTPAPLSGHLGSPVRSLDAALRLSSAPRPRRIHRPV